MAYDTVTISSPDGDTVAEFVPDANLVCSSLTHGGRQLLDLQHGLEAYAAHGKTMGIPLLYPWANRLSKPEYTVAGRTVELGDPEGRYLLDPNGLPIHGAVPETLRWTVTEPGADRLRATLAWEGELLSLFPFTHHVEVEAVVDAQSLRLTTTVHADGGDPVPVSFGYHPYLVLDGSSREGWQVDLGATEHVELDELLIPTGELTPLAPRDFLLAHRSFDDGLAGLETPAQFLVSDGEQALSTTFEAGYAWSQIYAPDGGDFICLEPMTAATDALRTGTGLTVLEAGESYRASAVWAVRP